MTMTHPLPDFAEKFILKHGFCTHGKCAPGTCVIAIDDVRALLAMMVPSEDFVRELTGAAEVLEQGIKMADGGYSHIAWLLRRAALQQPPPASSAGVKCKNPKCHNGAVLGEQEGILQHWGPCPDCAPRIFRRA